MVSHSDCMTDQSGLEGFFLAQIKDKGGISAVTYRSFLHLYDNESD